ncbi:PREDICTED: sushi, von Willebrand factor type A, EGF and pentraxin domain-containing protein 1-like isoform X1 [Poecilia mexicana]|nr:PREDICTED: sushi, von Willebrand factor type A, EGF and pentraxin domain-containing protein 1-like isoform X1 [Poecilia formosa]XP_014863196.1 PREDICTED: sushi, von Willebrand factor type A, EGF and pentraxin domain-containing protein 1-like isoform X1 [Poecilia mexicana]
MTRILSYDSDERADSWLNKVLVFSEPLRDEMLQTDPGWRFGLIRKRMDRLRLLSAVTAACFIGLVQSQTTLTPVVMNTTALQNATVVTPTPVIFSSTTPGCFSFNASTCEACAPGSQYDNNTLLCTCCPDPGLCIFPGACLPCKTGFYQPLAGQQECLACSRGSYTNFTGSPLCHPCPAGSFNNDTAAESCTSCSPGLFASKLGSTSCTPCPQGSFCNSSGCTQCPMCPGGTEALQTAAKDCTPCRPGMHKAPHQTMCQICSSGFYQILWGQESCDLCPENHYCPSPDVNPIQCPSDAFCPKGSTAPGYCMETFFRKAGDTCELAPVTIALLVIGGGVALLLIILLVLRRRRDSDGELAVARAPLLRKERPQGRYYGLPCDTEPVYAGW